MVVLDQIKHYISRLSFLPNYFEKSSTQYFNRIPAFIFRRLIKLNTEHIFVVLVPINSTWNI